jgi:putative transposase
MRGRIHSREFKLDVVRQVVNGERRPAQVCREHGLAEGLLLRWRHEYGERGEAAFTPRELSGPEALERKVADLERFCGQLALENALLKKGLQASATSPRCTRSSG